MSDQSDNEEVIAYKGMDKDLKCRGFAYEIGATYEHEGPVEACSSGFHACENPLDVWSYYGPTNGNRFCSVMLSGSMSRHNEDSKIAAGRIAITAEIGLPQLITDAVRFVMRLVKASEETTATTGDGANAATTGNYASAATTGYGANAATTGYRANAATTGNYANAATTGDGANAATTGDGAVAASLGIEGKAKAGPNGAIVLCNRDDHGNLRHIRASKVGDNSIKPDVFYTLNDDGEFVEVE